MSHKLSPWLSPYNSFSVPFDPATPAEDLLDGAQELWLQWAFRLLT